MSESKPRKILIVDDEPDILDMLEFLLDSEGYSISKAEGGQAAIEAIDEKPDLVLLDIMMPDMDGHIVLAEFRKRYDERELPVLMVTARNDVVDIGQALDVGVNGFVVKPFDTENLIRTVKSALEQGGSFVYENYERVAGVTSREGSGYQQGDRIIFLDLQESEPDADHILEALDVDGVYLMSILQFDAGEDRRQSSVLVTAENGIAFGNFLNNLLQSQTVNIAACRIYKDHLDLPHDLMVEGQEFSLEE